MAKLFVEIYLTACLLLAVRESYGLFEFPAAVPDISTTVFHKLPKTDERILLHVINLAADSLRGSERLESSLRWSNVVVLNGSVSHAQLLETLPSEQAQQYDRVARHILHSSLYFMNTECRLNGVPDKECAEFLAKTSIPQSNLRDQCLNINRIVGPDRPHAFRRLLPAYFKNGISEMFKEPFVANPRTVSLSGINSIQDSSENVNGIARNARNIALVQWAQFIEHDLSKSVVTTMRDGTPIECCDRDYKQLKPRYRHPACAPIKTSPERSYGREPCLNYVRSALAVDPNCKFGPIEMLNQATNSLDLSQVYGFSTTSKNRMRTFSDGLLKTSKSGSSSESLPFLPIAENSAKFCVNHAESCFMAGDSRVNSNPFMTLIYTIFLRSHNKIATALKVEHPEWDDERLYTEARRKNVEIYRCIIYNEWLPAVVGSHIADTIKNEPIPEVSSMPEPGVSNEYAVAASRFYYSMMPDVLRGALSNQQSMIDENIVDPSSREKMFALRDHYFESEFISRPDKMDDVMEAMMQQRAMDMDSSYVEDLTSRYLQTKGSLNKTSGIDALAWDIQRGRDHGLAGYVKYLETCAKTKIESWSDLAQYINGNDLERLKLVYSSFDRIDLIVGGISEKPIREGILGPTFTCILGEQFSNSWKYMGNSRSNEKCMTSSQLLCENTGLQAVPLNIFYTVSNSNPLVNCNKV